MRGSACRGDFAILAPFPVGLTFPLDLFRHVFTPRDFRGKTLPQPRRCCLRQQTSSARGGCAIVCGYALIHWHCSIRGQLHAAIAASASRSASALITQPIAVLAILSAHRLPASASTSAARRI